jgi:hypothetical protein
LPYKDKELGRQKKKEYYQRTREQRKAYDARPDRVLRTRYLDSKRRVERKKIAVNLLGGICTDCKKTYHLSCYDFHHEDPTTKEFDPCAGTTKKLEVFLNEIKKCVLLCANCHRLRHFKYETEFK